MKRMQINGDRNNRKGARRARRHSSQRWQIIGVFLLFGASIVLALTGSFSAPWRFLTAAKEGGMPHQGETHIGTVMLNDTDGRCKRLQFDNDNGRMSESGRPCQDTVVIGGQKVPAPTGTIQRLDAIKKSFADGDQ